MMGKKLLLSAIVILSLASCAHEVDYIITKKNTDYSDSYTSKDAYTIYYYQQPVTGETDLSAWDRDTSSDATNTYVPAGTSVSSLNNKGYEGFVFAGIVQNDTTINVYYKRCTISYEFYENYGDSEPLFQIQGLFGMNSVKPVVSDKDDFYFDSWFTKNQNAYTSTFCINSDSNTVNDVSTTKWYATWMEKSSVLGYGMNLINPGDILLKDGSVIPRTRIGMVSSAGSVMEVYLTDAQKNAAVAVLVTNTYNPATGSSTDGSKRLIAGLKTKEDIWLTSGNSSILYYQYFTTTVSDGKGNQETMFTLDENFRKSHSRSTAILYSCDYDINAEIASVYKNNWYLPSQNELKQLQNKELVDIFTIFGVLPGSECWSSTVNKENIVAVNCSKNGGTKNYAKLDHAASKKLKIIPFRQID